MAMLLIYGGGEMGRALAGVIGRAHPDVRMEICDQKEGRGTCLPVEIPRLAPLAEAALLCLPSRSVTVSSANLVPYMPEETPVVAVTKGMVIETSELPDELLVRTLGRSRIGLLYGPMLAEELEQRQ